MPIITKWSHRLTLFFIMNYQLSILFIVVLCGTFVTCLPVKDYVKISNPKTLFRVDKRSFGNRIAKRLGAIPTFDDNGDYAYMVMQLQSTIKNMIEKKLMKTTVKVLFSYYFQRLFIFATVSLLLAACSIFNYHILTFCCCFSFAFFTQCIFHHRRTIKFNTKLICT